MMYKFLVIVLLFLLPLCLSAQPVKRPLNGRIYDVQQFDSDVWAIATAPSDGQQRIGAASYDLHNKRDTTLRLSVVFDCLDGIARFSMVYPRRPLSNKRPIIAYGVTPAGRPASPLLLLNVAKTKYPDMLEVKDREMVSSLFQHFVLYEHTIIDLPPYGPFQLKSKFHMEPLSLIQKTCQ